MAEVIKLKFSRDSVEKIDHLPNSQRWPIVYIINNDKEAYVGETTNASMRIAQHLGNVIRRELRQVWIITDEEFNKSATLDMESWLIKYMSADGKYVLQNSNAGLMSHNYYKKDHYERKFKTLWEKLVKEKLAKKSLKEINNSDLFKYSPYKSLTADQYETTVKILRDITNENQSTTIVSGGAGTGKTVLATYLMKLLKTKNFDDIEIDDSMSPELDQLIDNLKLINREKISIALVVPMTSLRQTLKKVFKNVEGLSSDMVIGPADVTKREYDILMVDEAHRLRRRKNITNYKSFDFANKRLGLDSSGTELDWILRQSKHQILFYDKGQSIKPSDVRSHMFEKLTNVTFHELQSQLRVRGGTDYIDYINRLFECKLEKHDRINFKEYDFKLYTDIKKLIRDIRYREEEFGLSRTTAGYAWKWKTKDGRDLHDIEINGVKLKWNSTNQDWVNSDDAINEVGCIHTTQGYDLNYAGVILGPEISYNEKTNQITVDRNQYCDKKGSINVKTGEELTIYIKNIYRTLMARGILGTYVYVCDEKLKKYFMKFIYTA